jgi:phosphoserine phosphatase RsbU/P
VKLILTTSLVVSAAVFASAFFSQRAIRELARADAATRRAEGLAAIQREAELLARHVAATVALPLGSQQLSDLPPLLADAAGTHERIRWLLVVEADGTVVAATEGAPAGGAGTVFADALTAGLAGAPERVARQGAGPEWTYGAAVRLGGQAIGQVRIGVSSAELERALADSLRAADARAGEARRQMTLVALSLLGVGVVLAALQGLRMARPLRLLARQAERIAGGDLEQRVPEDRGDEIGALARSFNFMAGQLGRLILENAEKVSLEREMALARQVQEGMLPRGELVRVDAVRLVGHCAPASSCGGDWWTYRPMSGGRTLLVIGDATGHGLHSALIAATARGAVEALADADERLLTPEQVLRAIHAAIASIGDNSLLMTCLAVLIEPDARALAYANAGQNFPYVMRRGDDGALDEAQIIAASGNPLGDPAMPVRLRRGTVALEPGDVLVAFTDGVVERQNPAGRLFGDRRLRAVFRGRRAEHDEDLLDLRTRLVEAVEAFAEGSTAQDDVTFVLVQVMAEARAVRPAAPSGATRATAS